MMARRRRKPTTVGGGWAARVDTPDGDVRQLATCKLKREARELMDAYYERLDRASGTLLAGTLRAYVPVWLERYPRSPRTNTTNKYRVLAACDIVVGGAEFGDRPMAELTTRDATTVREKMTKPKAEGGKGWSPGYARDVLTSLSALVGDAIHDELMDTNVFHRQTKRVPRTAPVPRDERWRPWTLSQMRNFAAANPRYQAQLRVLCDGGLRVGEMLALARINVDWDRCMVYVEGTEWNGEWVPTSREKNHDRWVPLPDSTMELLTAVPPRLGCKWLFYTPGQVRQARADWPPHAELVAEIEATSHVAVARRLGVSDNAVRNRVRNHAPGVELAPAGGGKLWRYRNWLRDVWAPTCAQAGVAATPKQFRLSLNQHLLKQGVRDDERAAMLGHAVAVNHDHYTVSELADVPAIRAAIG